MEAERMLYTLDKGRIIGMKESGKSNREIARQTGHDRGKISQIWNEYCAYSAGLHDPEADIKTLQAQMTEDAQYTVNGRTRWKYTPELEARLRSIAEEEAGKRRRLGAGHKQKLTNKQIHEKLVEEGFDVSRALINIELSKVRARVKEVYICQEYEYGDRLEYDFGEVRLDCGEGVKVYHMAVLSSPAGQFRWAYLYTNQKKGVFMDSHVRFFEMIGGCWREIVYDNMKNVVSKFIGQGEKELNTDLVKMAAYYGFQINVTNCFKGNEKGHVESSVKFLRNKIFSGNYRFSSLEEAQEYLHSQLLKLNETSQIEAEKICLLGYKPPLELAAISKNTADKYSFIHVDTCVYSVPEYLVGQELIVKKYHDEIRVYAGNELVCAHKRIFGNGNMRVDIYHYLNTLRKKPGAIRNSVALKSIPRLKAIFDTHYSKQPRKFIEIFMENKELPINEIIMLFEERTSNRAELKALDVIKPVSRVEETVRTILINYSALVFKGSALLKEHEQTWQVPVSLGEGGAADGVYT